ncbi:SIS domain-containing protein [Mesorhizobium sp. YIM 152430]|uniref:SIS domain-containing protein n=1 Tax=Mesorhizobium sp. YIM 152430 TaxID=3031761 RepID=UPI0023DBDE0A|nr:SIS domain-containing protein [Mesorhizobium sp. YIM 152430]MDF1598917.1 SIS domain-containing protein [Mesorhizobium sp. YIM 152430]
MIATQMLAEAADAAEAIRRLRTRERTRIAEIAKLFATHRGPVTVAARGSSDHAVTAFKYAFEIATGRPVASLGPSIASVYRSPLTLPSGVHLTVSQSGASPDIIALQEAAAAGGAATIAIVNDAASPLARSAGIVLPIHAGLEKSVAATKTFVASAAGLYSLVAAITEDRALEAGLDALPDALERSFKVEIRELVDALAGTRSLFVTGRGPAYGIALEAALKAKETAGIHAEAFSTAELMHGPLQLVEPGFPVVALVVDDAARQGNAEALQRLAALGGMVLPLSTTPMPGGGGAPSTGHAITDTLVLALLWYRTIEAVARGRGLDPDRPANLRKVTETT